VHSACFSVLSVRLYSAVSLSISPVSSLLSALTCSNLSLDLFQSFVPPPGFLFLLPYSRRESFETCKSGLLRRLCEFLRRLPRMGILVAFPCFFFLSHNGFLLLFASQRISPPHTSPTISFYRLLLLSGRHHAASRRLGDLNLSLW